MMRKFILSVFIATLSVSACVAQSFTFTATYTFDSVKTSTGLIDPTLAPSATGVEFGNFSAMGTPANPSAAIRFSFKDWPTGSIDGDSLFSQLTGSIDSAEYYEVTLTPTSGYLLDLTAITFGVQRSSTGIRTYVVRSGVDGFAANLPASINPTNTKLSVETGDVFFWNSNATTTNQNGSTITLGGINFTSIANPTTFRFYGYNSEGSVGTFSIDNVLFTGTANAIPTSIINNVSTESVKGIYPNPSANGVFTIDLGNISKKTTIVVYNILGKTILTKEINATSKNSIDLSNEVNGTYFITIKNDTASSIQKIVINK